MRGVLFGVPDPNTIIHGWPVPTIILQRDNSTSPWLDYVGPTTILGLPMNFVLFMILPAITFLSAATWRRWHFSLRNFLMAITLACLVLGLLVYALS